MKILQKVFIFGILFLSFTTYAQSYEVQTNTPVYSAIPKNAVGVRLLEVTLEAKENLFLSQLLIQVSGMISSGDFDAIWAETTDSYRSLRTRFSNKNQAKIRFFTPVFIPEGTSKTFYILGNFDADTGGRSFEITLDGLFFQNPVKNPAQFPSKNSSLIKPISPTISTEIPSQPLQQVASIDISEVQFQVSGSSGNIRMGRVGEIGKFRLVNKGSKEVQLQSIRFRNYGNSNLEKSFDTFLLQNNGQEIQIQTFVEGDYITLQFENFFLGGGDSVLFSLRARLIYAQGNESVQLGIQRAEDFVASVKGTDFGARLTGFEGVQLQEHTLSPGGILSSVRQSIRSTYRNYRRSRTSMVSPLPVLDVSIPGARDVVFLSTFFTQKNSFSVEGVFIPLKSGTDVSDKDDNGIDNEISDIEQTYNSFQLFIDDHEVDSTNNFTSYDGQIGLMFDTNFDIEPQSQMRIVGRITYQALSGDKLAFDKSHIEFFSPILKD